MTIPERTSTVINAGLVLYGQAVFGPQTNPLGVLEGGKASFEDYEDPVLSPSASSNAIELVRRAVRRSRRS